MKKYVQVGCGRRGYRRRKTSASRTFKSHPQRQGCRTYLPCNLCHAWRRSKLRRILIGKKKEGTLCIKELYFGIGYNEFFLFPQENYSDLVALVPCPGNKYKCAVCGDFPDENHTSESSNY